MSQLRWIRTNQNGQARRITHNGREYVVAPMMGIVAGVLNGELVPAEELAKFPEAWNGRPVVIGHPMARGQYISANSPDIVAGSPGYVWNTEFKNDRLLFEVWLDVEKARLLGGQALQAMERLERNEPTEGSTGYFRDIEPRSGTLNGKAYSGIARNIRPDHYAILLDEVGACSWQDGCGGPRVNQAEARDTVWLGFWLSPDRARQLALGPGDLPEGAEAMRPEELHLTLAMLGKIDDMPCGENEALQHLAAWAEEQTIVSGVADGLGRFAPEGAEMQPVFATFNQASLGRIRESLVGWFEGYFPINRQHGFQPHITLAYVPAAAEVVLPPPKRLEIVFDSVAMAWGNRVTAFKLQGEAVEVGMAEQSGGDVVEANRSGLRAALKTLARAVGINFSDQEVGNVAENQATKAQLCDLLAANARCSLKRETLEKLELAELQALAEALKEPAQAGEQQVQGNAGLRQAQDAAQGQQNQGGEDATPAWAKTLTDQVNGLATQVQGLQAQVQANAEQEKATLIEEIAANQEAVPKSALEKMSIEELQKFRQYFVPADFSGRGLPRANSGDWEEYQMPEANGAGK